MCARAREFGGRNYRFSGREGKYRPGARLGGKPVLDARRCVSCKRALREDAHARTRLYEAIHIYVSASARELYTFLALFFFVQSKCSIWIVSARMKREEGNSVRVKVEEVAR